MTDFVNPYTFVPFPQVDDAWFRHAPAGHHRLGTAADGSPRLMGTIEVELTARSPLLMSDGTADQHETHGFPRRRFPEFDGPVPYLPGSSLAGVFRSLHESVAGGCLRIFEDEYLPSYRDAVEQARSLLDIWTLALVSEVDSGTGQPRTLHLCTDLVRIRHDALNRALGGPRNIVTGTRVDISPLPPAPARGLRTITDPTSIRKGGDWVVLVTDARTREGRQHYYYTAGLVSFTDENTFTWNDSWLPAWQQFQRLIGDTDDMRQARQNTRRTSSSGAAGPVEKEVVFLQGKGKTEIPVGRRHAARRELFPGQVIWVKLTPDETSVAEFALSSVWRHTGTGKAGDRVPPALSPCQDPRHLCPTCRVFGATDTAPADLVQAEQQSYRGHLRFSDARPLDGIPQLERRELPMLSRPRPGAGQFYLEYDARTHNVQPRYKDVPLREWGSPLDAKENRQLRGRKHYWLTGRYQERPYFRLAKGSLGDKLERVAQSVPANTRFGFTVRFANLDLAELGALLAALSPGSVLHSQLRGGGEIGFAVGGGRPLGFGTCTSQITALTVHTADTWYGSQQPVPVTAAEAVAAFTQSVHSGVRVTWPALAAALHLDHVPPDKVWYPPEKPIPDGELTGDDLEPGYDFWQETRGYATKNTAVKMLPLPHVLAADQHLKVIRKKGKR
ncbi:RAMP superfamily CRISPR-associated protein [Goodfellowiella coeruleoviolacea]|uniref:CRISPR-associated protein n=1 Tax=Goodfellowiella coeruleoviolacea TaxID=334858 RepID=A0AAE3GLA1_9PSEU|nr:RAMP superfamily CRISPR-associated protein [Goodfellowiella coeruleoviolacea]MCP2170357.1 CRISPR-associated protein [Goodfellowiella coeruleoviolacea]